MQTRLFHFVLGKVFWISLGVIFFSSFFIPSLPSAQQKLRDDLFSVSFPNEKDGWACGRWGLILHSSDGGRTWIRQNTEVDFTLVSIYFVDSQNGWAVGDSGTILHTIDGGKRWDKQKSPVSYFLMGVYFASSLKGWIVTERTHILHTEDGGKAWRVQFKDEDYILKAVSFSDPLNGWAVGEYGYIYHTRNGGNSWRKQFGSFSISEETGDIVADPFLYGVVAINSQTAWAVGVDGYVAKTVDGGKTWTPVSTGAPKTHLFCVTSDKKEMILIGGRGIFLSSVDKGRTWRSSEFKPPITYGWIYGLSQRGSSGFIAVGWRGAIYSSNSVTLWERVNY
jgi:photosystem II stability/assembly factor-like uncharacterized protein